jgi:hypothetical protein
MKKAICGADERNGTGMACSISADDFDSVAALVAVENGVAIDF